MFKSHMILVVPAINRYTGNHLYMIGWPISLYFKMGLSFFSNYLTLKTVRFYSKGLFTRQPVKKWTKEHKNPTILRFINPVPEAIEEVISDDEYEDFTDKLKKLIN